MTRHVFRPAPLALAVSLMLGSSAIWAQPVEATSAGVAGSSTVQSIKISAQPLGDALNAWARQTGAQVAVEQSLVDGKTAPAVSGNLTAQQALNQLLAGSGLVGNVSGKTVVIRSASTSGRSRVDTLPEVVVTASSFTAIDSVNGVVATRSASGTKTDTPIIMIPQTVNVVTADEIEARASSSLTEILRYTPGVSVTGFTDANDIADEVNSRGFSPSPLYIDGGYLPYAGSLGGSPQIEPYWLERVEVLKGPASVLYGQNQPGGIINMITKKPLAGTFREARISYDSNGQKELGVDLSGSVNTDKSILYRFTGLVKGGDGQINFTESDRIFLAPSLTLKPTNQTSITLYGSYQKDNSVPDYQALPYIGTVVLGPDGKYIDRDFFTGEPGWNDFKRDQFILGADLDQSLNDSIKIRSRARYVDLKDDYRGFNLSRFITNSDGTINNGEALRTKFDWAQHNSVFSFDNNVEFSYATGSLQHTLLMGADYRRFTRKYDGYNTYNSYAVDLYSPDYRAVTAYPALTTRWDNTLDQIGVYVQDQIEWNRFVLTAGGRFDWASIDNKTLPLTAGSATTVEEQDDRAFTGRLGLTYLFDNGFAPYASYSESFLPQLGMTYEGDSYDPLTGQQYEVGVKYAPPGMNAMFTLSAFHLNQQNMLTTDYDHTGYYVQEGEVRARGLEFEAKGELLSGWTVIGGVSYIDSENTKASSNQGNKTVLHAPWSASLWNSYEMQSGILDGFNIGGGLRFTGSKFADAANTLKTPSFTVFDAALTYDLGKLRPDWNGAKATLNVENIFDRTYVSRCNWAFGCYYGNARTIRAGLSVKF